MIELLFTRQVPGHDALAGHIFLFMRAAFFFKPFGHFGHSFAVVDSVTFSSSHSSMLDEIHCPPTIRMRAGLPITK